MLIKILGKVELPTFFRALIHMARREVIFCDSSAFVFSVRFVAIRYMLQQKCLNGQIELACYEHASTAFSPLQCTLTLRATMVHSVTDRQRQTTVFWQYDRLNILTLRQLGNNIKA